MADTLERNARLKSILPHVPLLGLMAFGLYDYSSTRLDLVLTPAGLAGALAAYSYSLVRLATRADDSPPSGSSWWLIPLRTGIGFTAGIGAAAAARAVLDQRTWLIVLGFVAGQYSSVLIDVIRRRMWVRMSLATVSSSIAEESKATAEPQDILPDEEPRLQAELARTPINEAAIRRLIEEMRRNRRYHGAVALYDRLLGQRPRDYELIVQKAELYLEMADRRRYIETIAQAERIRAEVSFEQNIGTSITVASAEVRGLEFFGDFKWPLQPTVNVLLGRNGYGKSHLLRAIVATLQNDTEITRDFVEGASPDAMIRVETRRGDTTVQTVRKPLVFEETAGKIPVLAIPDMRYIDKSGETFGPSQGAVVDLRSQGAENFMRDQSFESVILTFLYDICIDYFDAGKTFDLPVFRLIEKTLQDLMRRSPDTSAAGEAMFRFHDVRRLDNARFEIRVITDGNESTPLPLQKASQGTLSVLSMVGLVFKYLSKLYANVPGTDVPKQQGIVVIDEIDAHLHPVWQQRVLQVFRETFPNVQFIVTAHTPLVVAGCRSHEVAILQKHGSRFAVNVLEKHFIGATAADMYEELFEIEEKDLAFLQFKALAPEKGEIERKVTELERQQQRSAAQESTLKRMKDQLYYLDEVEEVSAKRDEAEDSERQRQGLELELMNLRGEVARLRADLAQQREIPEALDVSGAVEIIREFIEKNPTRAHAAEPFVKYLSSQGGYKEAASLLEVLHRSEPGNIGYMKGLAVQYQALKEYPKAAAILRRAQTEFPADKSVQAALRHLETMQRAPAEG